MGDLVSRMRKLEGVGGVIFGAETQRCRDWSRENKRRTNGFDWHSGAGGYTPFNGGTEKVIGSRRRV
jgi:hypothetical protein